MTRTTDELTYLTITGETPFRMADSQTGATTGLTESDGEKQLAALREELRELHDLMMAAETHGVLVVLQGMDASGKDVTIENVHTASNPQAARVKGFKPPAGEEVKHHFLRRAAEAVPMRGEIVAFDRSYYEQAMPEKAGGEVSGDALERRYRHIRAFEDMLNDDGIIVIKLLLNVDKDVQKGRLEERQNDIRHGWKLSASDWKKREIWDEVMAGYEAMINATATDYAPWYVVPSDEHWYRNLCAAQIVVDRMRPFRAEWEQTRNQIGEQNQREAREVRYLAGQLRA
ncbi:MAG TPA: PPK2 family polyphosphate kinase [Thermomicrobiales bacterium]|jgi:PPK2 family polyphosphate:nucleotide phosphotransferase|nr:PPK2 family polyphosphate kinase [Thermomicrobiales bacterium]